MARTTYTADELSPPVGPFSQAVAAGEFVYLSGQTGQDASGQLVEGDVAAQTAQIFHNLEAVLRSAGKTLNDVIKVHVFLTDMADFGAMNAEYARHFGAPYPARTTIGVAALPLGARVEIDVVAR